MALRAFEFTPTAVFAGDTWEFQSVAVNFAKGRGFPKFGGVGPFEEYRFDAGSEGAPHYARFVEAGRFGGEDHFYRTPAYPFLLGLFYRAAGVRPGAAKAVQGVAYVFAASVLVWLGSRLWGDSGLLAGFFSGPLYVAVYGYQAGLILTEPLLMPTLTLVACAYLLWAARPDAGRAAWLGVGLAVLLLVKGSTVFLPPLLLGLTLLDGALPLSARTKGAAVAACTAILCVLPYSRFASSRVGKSVILSTQGDGVLLNNNNEYALAAKGWSSDWRLDPESHYNRVGSEALPAWRRVVGYYLSRPSDLPAAVSYKLETGFKFALFLKFILCALILDGLAEVVRARASVTGVRSFGSGVWLLALLVLTALAAFRAIGVIPLLAFATLIVGWARGPLIRLFPRLHAAVLLNFILVMAIIDGVPRYFSVAEPLFILLAFRVFASAVLVPLSEVPGDWRRWRGSKA